MTGMMAPLQPSNMPQSSPNKGKSAGPDGIISEVTKNCDLDDIVREHCNHLNDKIKPEIWSLSNIPVPKSRDLSKTDNHRGISLICTIAKMVNSMIFNEMPLIEMPLILT